MDKINDIEKSYELQRRIDKVMNIMWYYPFIELGLAIESVKDNVEIQRMKHEAKFNSERKLRSRRNN